MHHKMLSFYFLQKEPVVSPVDISKPAAPVIKKVVSGAVLQPRTTPVSSSRQSKMNTHDNVDLSKLEDHPGQGQDGSQADYSPALNHSSNRSLSGLNSSTSVGDDVRSQGSSKSSRSQTSEVDSSYILPSNNIESVFIKPANDDSTDWKETTTAINPAEKKSPGDQNGTEFCETSFDSDLDETATKSEESTDTKNDQTQPKSPNTPEVVKSTNPCEKADELKQFPSISDKMMELEKRSRRESGTTKQGRPKSPLPPVVPKRVSSISNMKTSKPPETGPDTVKASTKTAAPSPKRLSIPEKFLEKLAEEQNSLAPPKPSGAQTKRIEIPSSLELIPPPPPLSTHPGLTSKMKEEEDKEKLQPQMGKKRRGGIFKLKKRNSKREKDKRTSLTEELTLLGSEESNKNSSPTRDQSASAPRRLSGVPTPALSPGTIGGDGAELESKFKSITKQEWNPETFELKDTDHVVAGLTIEHDPNTSALTFGHPSPSPHKKSGQRAPSATSESQIPTPVNPKSMTTSPAPVTQESMKNKHSLDDIDGNEPLEGVGTFLPSKKTQPVTYEVQKGENTAAMTTTVPSNSSTRTSSSNITENGIHTENGITGTQSSTVPGVKQASPINKTPARSPKHQMPPGFMLVTPTQPPPQQFTAQRRLPNKTTYDYEQPSKHSKQKPAASAPGPMNTKRGGGGLKKKKSFIFKKQ